MDFKELEIEKRWLLLTRIDREKFRYFYEKYQDRIYRYCYRHSLNRDIAQDLTAETFLRAQNGLWKFRFQGVTMGAWLYRIAQNVIREHDRDRVRTPEAPLDADLLAGGGRDPLEDMLLTDDRRHLAEAMDSRLDELGRAIIELHYWADLAVSEIAAVLDVSEGTVKARLSRDRKKLKQALRARRFVAAEERPFQGERSEAHGGGGDDEGDGGAGGASDV